MLFVCTVGHGNQIECKERRDRSEKNRMMIRHRNEMDALYLAMSCECLNIGCEYRIFVKIWMFAVDVSSVTSKRKIQIVFKMYLSKSVWFHTVVAIYFSVSI